MKKSVLTIAAAVALCGLVPQDARAAATAYVTAPNIFDVFVVDLESATLSDTIEVGAPFSPRGIAAFPDGTNLLTVSSDISVGQIFPLDGTAGTVGTAIPLGKHLQDVAISADGNTAVVTDFDDLKVFIIEPDGTPIRTVDTTVAPLSVVINSDSTKAYVTSGDNVLVLDLAAGADGSTDDSVAVGAGPQGIDINSDGSKVFVVNSTDETVSVIDTASNAVDITYPVGDPAETEFPRDLAVSPDGTKVYVITHFTPSTIFILNATDGADLGSITGFHDSVSIDLDDNGNVAVVANAGGTALGIANLEDKTVTEVEVGGSQFGLAVVGGVGEPPAGSTTGGTTTGGTTTGSGSGTGGCSLVR